MAVDPTEIQIGETVYIMNNNLPAIGEISNTVTEPTAVDSQIDTFYLKGQGNKKYTTEAGKVNSVYTTKEDFITAMETLINNL